MRWQDVELEHGIIHIRHTLTRYGGSWHFSDPKTEGSRRDVKLTPGAVEALERQQVKVAELEMAAAIRWQEHGLVFPSSIGTPQYPQPVRTALHRTLDRLGLPQQRFHDLRHCAASLLLAEGADIFTVKEVLGHRSIAMTGDIYGHLTKKLADEAAARLGRAMASTPALDAKSDARID